VTRDKLMQALQQVRGSQRVTDQNPEGKYQTLEKYGRDLTELARRGKIDPVIGRDNEIRRIMQVLSRRTKNNPVLIGDPGVGKTAIVEGIAQRLRKGHLIVLESTTYPYTTREVVLPILERGGLEVGQDFHLAFSPERVDPGRTDYTMKNVPKVVGGITPACTKRAAELYGTAIDTVHEVSTPEAAELTKLLENIFRSVNIALVNELAQLCDRMKIDVWEVIEAAGTKPFGFMTFKPGPGLGGHCIPIDPFYLTWKAREYGFYTEFIELAGKVNENMPYYCRSVVSQALNHGAGKALSASKVLVLGVSYKPDIGDMRESPALKVIELLRTAGAEVSYHDPHVPELEELGLRSVALEPAPYDCVTIVTDHSGIDYADVVAKAGVVVDFRNATRGIKSDKVWKL